MTTPHAAPFMATPVVLDPGVAHDEFRLAIETIPGLVWTALPDGWVDFLNRRWCDYTGLAMHEAVGWGWQSAVCPDDLPGLRETWTRVLASGVPGEAVARLRRRDGVDRWFLFRAVPLHDERGDVVKWYGQTTDIEERRRAEMLLAGEKRLLEMIATRVALPDILGALCRHAEETLGDGYMVSIPLVDATRQHFLRAMAPSMPDGFTTAMTGARIDAAVGPCGMAVFNAEPIMVGDIEAEERWSGYRALAHAHGLRACWSTPIVSQQGKVLGTCAVYARHPGLPTSDQREHVAQIVNIASVAIERAQAERAVRHARMRGLEARYAAMMEERTRLAREIHDTLLQGFNGVALMLMAATRKVEGPPDAVTALQHVLDLAQATLGDARRAVWDLRAPTAQRDFPATLRAGAEDALHGSGVALDFAIRGRARVLDASSEGTMFRVAQEAIANVVKHASATNVRVRLTYRARGVRLSVRDNGRGFTVDPDFRAYGGHWGLLGMWERASRAGGRLRVESAPGAGTRIVLTIP